MNSEEIKTRIKKIKEFNKDIGNELLKQLTIIESLDWWSFGEIIYLLKEYDDVAGKYYQEDDEQYSEIRAVQNLIINFYGE